jgi:hypothetical protein
MQNFGFVSLMIAGAKPTILSFTLAVWLASVVRHFRGSRKRYVGERQPVL